MRKLSYLLPLFLLATTTVAAQVTATPQPRPNIVMRVTRLSLHGITLNDAERAGIKGVADTHRPAFQALGQTMKTETATLRTARQAHDTAAAIAARKALRQTRGQVVTALRAYLADVRTKLPAADQTTFDANMARVRAALRRQSVSAP